MPTKYRLTGPMLAMYDEDGRRIGQLLPDGATIITDGKKLLNVFARMHVRNAARHFSQSMMCAYSGCSNCSTPDRNRHSLRRGMWPGCGGTADTVSHSVKGGILSRRQRRFESFSVANPLCRIQDYVKLSFSRISTSCRVLQI